MRKLRDLIVAGVVGGVLVLGGTALADVPDTQPNTPDPAHVLWFCVASNSTAYKNVYALDDSEGECPGPTWRKVPTQVVITSTTP